MSLNKFTDTQIKSWMKIGANEIVATTFDANELKCDNLTATGEIKCEDLIVETNITATGEIKCEDLSVENNTFPAKTFFTTFTQGINFNDPEKNVLINGIGTTSYLGDDIEGSSTEITSLFEFIFVQNDVYKFRLKRGGQVLKEFDFQFTGGSGIQMTAVIWTIDTRTVGTGGTALIQLQIKSGDQSNGLSSANPRYLWQAVQNDTTLQGDYEFTIEPVAVNVNGSIGHWQSSITRSHSTQV